MDVLYGWSLKRILLNPLYRLHLDHERPHASSPPTACEPDYINLAVLRRRLLAQPAGLARFPNVIGYASTQRILELYGNPHTPLLPDSGKGPFIRDFRKIGEILDISFP